MISKEHQPNHDFTCHTTFTCLKDDLHILLPHITNITCNNVETINCNLLRRQR